MDLISVSLLNWAYFIVSIFGIGWASRKIWVQSQSEGQDGKTHFDKHKRGKANSASQIANYLWRKHYRLLIFIVSLLISWVILFADNVLRIGDIPPKDELSALLLLATAAVVFWYTRETFDLKVITQNAKTIQQRLYDYETLPYLRLQWSDDPSAVFHIKNEGRGIAVDVAFETFEIQQTPRIPIVIKRRPALAPSGWSAIKEDELKDAPEIIDSLSMRGLIDAKLKKGEFKTVHVTYEDLRKRIFEVEFVPDESYNDRFRISFQRERR